jgi:hypothetical protein
VTPARALAVERIIITAGVIGAGVVVYLSARTIGSGRFGDFPHFYDAALAVRAGGDVHLSGSGGYIYPPLLAFLFQPLTLLPLPRAVACWLVINTALIAIAVWIASRDAVRRFGLSGWMRPVPLVAALAFLLTFDKTLASFKQAQTDSLVILGFVLGLYWLERRPALAGIALGFAANIKYLSLIAVPYLLLRRRWSAATWAIGSTLVWAMLPAASLGWEQNLRSLTTAGAGLLGAVGIAVGPVAANMHDATWHLSISITSAVARALGSDAGIATKALATLLPALVILGGAWAIYQSRQRPLFAPPPDPPVSPEAMQVAALEWAGLIVASLAFGPQTTGRHLVLVIGIHAMVGAILLGAPRRRRAPLVAGLVFFQLGMVLPPGGRMFAGAVDAWRAVAGVSWCLVAMYLSLLWVALPRPRRPGASSRIVNPPLPDGIEHR